MTTPLLRIPGGAIITAGPVTMPAATRSVVVDNPLATELFVLFQAAAARAPSDASGPLYDRIIPPLSHVVIPKPDGATNVAVAGQYSSTFLGSLDANRIASLDASECPWAPSFGLGGSASSAIVPEATSILTGSAVVAPAGALTWNTGGPLATVRFLGAQFTCDVAGIVTIGTHIGPGTGVTSLVWTLEVQPGIPYNIPLGPRGWLFSTNPAVVSWAATHSVSGATLAWNLALGTT